MKYLVANWKSNKRIDEALEWLKKFKIEYQPNPEIEVIVAVPYPFVEQAARLKSEIGLETVKLAVQDISQFPYGAYTGAVAVEMVEEWIDWTIIGHSERRQYFHETDQEIANKAARVREVGLGTVLCVDEPYARSQRAAMDDLSEQLVVAYEPIKAIGTGDPEDPKAVEETVKKIKEIFEEVPVLYGGSTTPENAREYLQIPGVNGLLVGGASLHVEMFAEMCKAAAEV